MTNVTLRTAGSVALGVLFSVGCAGAVEPAPVPVRAESADASSGAAAGPAGPALDVDAGLAVEAVPPWSSDAVCNAGARTVRACCDLGAADCAALAELVRCCGDRSCEEGKQIACMAAFVPSKTDNCLGAFSACNRM
jgi:hypothetical protein